MTAEQGTDAQSRRPAALAAMLGAIAAVCAVGGLFVLVLGQGQLGTWRTTQDRMSWNRPAATLLPRLLFEDEARQPLSSLPFHDGDPVQIAFPFKPEPTAATDLAVLATGLGGTARAFVNFAPVRAGGEPLSAGPAMPDSRIILWDLPADHLHQGANRIDLVVTGSTGRALAGPVFLGPGKILAGVVKRWERSVRAMHWVLFGAATAALIVNLLAAGFRGATLHLAAAAGFAVVATRSVFGLLGIGPQIGPLATGPLLVAALAACASIALRRLSSPATLAIEEKVGLLATALCAGAAIAAAATGRAELAFWSGRAAGAAALTGLAWAIIATLRHSHAAADQSNRTRLLHGALCGLLLVTGTIMTAELAALSLPAAPFASAAMVTVAIAAMAMFGIVQSLGTIAEGLRIRLDHARTIREQRAALEAARLALEEQTRQALLLEERQRMARDVHDGIGGQLATLIAQVRLRRIGMDQVEQALVGGLSELRFLVGSLDVMGASLADALATFLDQARQQTAAAGMTLDWSEDFNRADEVRDARWILNIYRLMQEAVTNAIRHSGGNRIAVSISAEAGQLALRIEDNGSGMDPETVRRGRGLNNMERRASDLGGTFAVGPGGSGEGASGQGTAITVRVPLPA